MIVTKLQKKIGKTFYQSILTFGIRGFGVLFLFCLTILMTRNFSTMEVGQYEFTRVVLLVLGSIALLGTDVSIIYFSGKLKASNSSKELGKTYYQILKIILYSSLVIAVVLFILSYVKEMYAFVGKDNQALFYKIIFVLPFYVITIFNTETLRAIGKPVLSELFRNVFKYCSLLFGIALFISSKSSFLLLTEYFLYGFILLACMSQLILTYCFSKNPSSQKDKIFSSKEIIKNSFPMGISSIIMFLLLSVDVFLLKKNFGNSVVAFYAVAIKLITILSMVILSLNINCSPRISELFFLNEKKELQCLCRRTARITTIVNVSLSIIMICFISRILFFFGEDYIYIKEAFFILITSQIVTSFFGVVPVYLNMTGRSHVFQYILLLTLFVNIILNIILIPIYGVVGAAIVFSLSVILWNVIVAIYVYKKDHINLLFI